MEGYLLNYRTNLSALEMTKLNSSLFGRVINTTKNNRKRYYFYSGLLDSIRYIKICKGCYFIENRSDNDFDIPSEIKVRECNLNITEDILQTPRELFREKYTNIRVVNL
ncbi:MAG: hypothetical protein B7C24_13685 [Bacteroidetes bacterium 4572_77]|nr:MAG: hypothetical protein B7C24_13685 [Bacteroidetes bacterium 4572_77]